ncbi:MAG: TraR/DksA family transcriptional regulator [Micavibrio sp.]
MPIDLEHYKNMLVKHRAELLVWAEASKATTKPVELDQTMVGRLSRMDAIQQQEMALATERRREQELYRIDAALKRIESGDYGYCIKCDEEINPKRLDVDPTTLTCVHCAASGDQ